MRVDIVTILPRLFDGFLAHGMVGLARRRGRLEVVAHDLRDWTDDRHRSVDDAPYGGGPGMIMKPGPLVAAVEAIAGPRGPARRGRVVLLSPAGRRFDQAMAGRLAGETALTLVCGRYEGVDQRVADLAVDEEVSIGDYVLSGGEVAAMVVVETVSRLLEGVLGNPESAASDSFGAGLLEGPQYTRPAELRGLRVPEVLLSGDHGAVARWRSEQAKRITRERRPDLPGADSREEER